MCWQNKLKIPISFGKSKIRNEVKKDKEGFSLKLNFKIKSNSKEK